MKRNAQGCEVRSRSPVGKSPRADRTRQNLGRSSGLSHRPRPSREWFPVAREGADCAGTDGGGTAPDLNGIPF